MGACKHHVVPAQGKGRQQQKHQALLHIRKADTALSRRVIDSCLHFLHREKPPTASQHQSQPWQVLKTQKVTLTETTDVNTTPNTQVQTPHDTPGCVQQWEQTGILQSLSTQLLVLGLYWSMDEQSTFITVCLTTAASPLSSHLPRVHNTATVADGALPTQKGQDSAQLEQLESTETRHQSSP